MGKRMLISIISSPWRYSIDSQIHRVLEEKEYVRLIYPLLYYVKL